ncbi:MAG: hypothetical protein K6T65_16825 [Peptococcaceae bacterium]|nr:hypothetical protein [Peptococcaceae bacterium]
MRKILIAIIIVGLLLLNAAILEDLAVLEKEVVRLKQERFDLEARAALLDRQVRELRDQHEKLVWISQDIDQRLIRAEGKRRSP